MSELPVQTVSESPALGVPEPLFPAPVRREAEIRLYLRWAERGGPPVKKPTRTGFGSRLIERSLARELAGEVALTYEETGVICTIDAPVPPPGLLERKSAGAPARIAPLPLAG